MKKDLLTIQQAADYLGISTRTLRRWEAKGHLKPQRTAGNQRRFSKSELDILFSSSQAKPGHQPQNFDDSKENSEEATLSSKSVQLQPSLATGLNTQHIEPVKPSFRSILISGAIVGIALFFGLTGLLFSNQQINGLFKKSMALLMGPVKNEAQKNNNNQSVLAATNRTPAFEFDVNLPSVFGQKVTFLDNAEIKKSLQVSGIAILNGGVKTDNANINAGTGKITASNLVYSVLSGTNITISGSKQNPKISATIPVSVTSLQGQTGAVSLTSGSGISLNGLQISNAGVLSVGGATGNVSLTAGSGISISGTTITNSDTGSAQDIFKNFTIGSTTIAANSNNDTINFAAGSGILLTGNSSTKTITITSNASGSLAGLTTNSVLYATSSNSAGSIAVGSTGTVLHGITNGAPVFSAVNLSSDVTGILPIVNGGTGVSSTPSNGQVLIGNGGGYQLSTLTTGPGIGIANGAGSITITNSGVLSLTGTANQVTVSGATGPVTLSLPQDIDKNATPIFSALSLTSNTNQLTLGSGANTAVVTTTTLTAPRTYTFPDASGTVCLTSGNCTGTGGSVVGSGTLNYLARFTSSSGVGDSSIYDNGRVAIGSTSPQGLFSVSGAVTGLALVNLNETGDQNILVGSASGITRFSFDTSGNLNLIGGTYQIGGLSVLSSTTLGSVVTSSSLTSVGVLSQGSIATGFGSINVGTNNISGGTVTATGTTGYTATGIGAGIGFSGTGNHIISASSGTLEVGAATLTGAITGNSQNVTGLNNLSAAGTIIFSGLGTGIAHVSSAGVFSSSAVNLASSDVTGILPVANGGTNTTAVPTAGAIAYGTGSAYGFSAAGTAGQVLESGGTGSPTWVSAASVGTNYFQLNSGVLSPITLTNDLAIGGSATTSALFQVSGTTGNATTSGIFTFGGTTAQLQATANRTLTLGGSSTGNIVLSSNGNIILNSFGAGVVHTSATGALSTGLVQNSELQNSTITVNGGTGLGVSGSPVALGGTLTLSNTGVTSALAGSGISLSGATGAVTITNAGVTSLNAGTGALTLANSSLTGSTITINNATTTTEGIASFNSTNFSISSGAVNTIQNINTSASPTFSGITLSGLTSGQFVKTTTGGQLTTSQYVNLTSDVTGILPVANGGTNTTAVPTAGAIAYGTGSAYGFSAAGTAGQVLESGGTGSPTWVSAASVGTNYFQLNSGVLSPITLTNDLAIGGSATTSALFQVSGTTGNATTSGIFTFGGTTAQLQATANRTLTLGGSSTGNIVLSSNGNIILNSFGAGVVHTSATGALSTGLVQNSELQNSTITVNGGTGLGVSGSPVALGGTLTLSNTGVTSALAGSGISLSGATGAVTITNAGVTSLNAGTGALTLANSSLTGSTITINNATTTTEGIASFNSTNFSISSGAVNTIQNINTSASPTFSGITLSGLTSGQFVKTTTGGQLTTSQYVNLTSDVTGILPVANGGTNTTAVPTAGAIAYGTGSAYGFSAAGTAGQVLESGGTGSPTWVSAASVGTNYFQLNSGVLSPITLTNDLAIGGSATTSALFQVSGTTGNATTSGIFTFGGTTAQLQATANRTLTLGGSSTGNIVLSSNGNIILNSFGAGVVHTSATGALSTGLVQNSELQNSTITVNGGTGLGVSGSPVALGGTLTLSNTGVTSALAGSGISLSGATGAVTITNAGVTSLNAGTGALTLANSSLTGSTITINNATTTTEGIASFNSTNFSISSGAVNTIQNINTSASPTFSGITLSGLTSGQFVKTTTGGQLTTSQYVNLTSDVTGILPVANGGTNTTAVPTAGAIAYGTGSAYGFSAAGTAGQVLESGGTGSPTWVSAASVGTNYFQLNSGVLSPITLTNDLAIGGSATTSALFQVSGTTGNATTSGIFTFGGTTAQLQATANRTLTLGGSSTGNIVLSSNGNIILNSFGAGVVHTSATGALSTGLVQNSELQNSTITVNGGTGLGVSGSPVALGGTLTLSNTGVTSALAGSGISLSGATGAVTITNAGVTSLNAGTGALTLANSSLTGSTITINNATTTTEGIASFNSTNFSISSGAVNTIQNINTSASPTFSGITLSGLTSGQFVKTTTGGQLTTSQYVNLTSDVTGILPVINGGSPFEQANGAILERIATQDFLLGGTATTSAEFAVTGINTNTPVASLSGSTGGIYLNAAGVLATTDKQSLILGDTNTGNIVLNGFGAGALQTDASGVLSTGTLSVGFGGTGLSGVASGSLLYGSGGSTLNAISISGTSGECLISNGTAPAWQACPGSGSGSSKWNLSGSVIYPINTGYQVGIGTTSVGNELYVTRQLTDGVLGQALAIFNQTENQDILTASASGATEFTVANNGSLQFTGGSGHMNTLESLASANQTIQIPNISGGTDTVCLVTLGNCAGSGSGITGSGTVNQLAFFNGSNSLTSDAALYFDSTNKLFGIGNASPVAKLDLKGAVTGKALAIFNETGDQAIFTASASGTPEFTIGHDGTLTAAKYTTANGLLYTTGSGVVSQSNAGTSGQVLLSNSGTPTFTSLSGDIASITGTGVVALKSVGTAGVYGSASQVPVFTTDAQGRVTAVTNTAIAIDTSQITSGTLSIIRGGTNTTAAPTAGAIAYGTGSAYGFSAAGTAGQVLESGGTGSPTWVNAASVGTNYFQLNSGVLSPITLTNDLAIGGSATTSALFQVSGTTGNATTSGIFTFGGTTAQLQATANRTLTLGGSSTGNIVLSSNGNIILNSFGAGVVHTSATGALSTGLVQNSELQNSTITVNGGTGLGVSGSPVALGGTLTLSNTGVTSALAGSGISLSGATGAVTITNAGVTSLNAGTGALTLANSSLTGSTITINNATTTTEGIASFNSTNFSISSGAVNTIQNINTSASPTFSGITLSGLTSGQFVKTTTGGQLTTSQYVNLTSDVTGILPVANGGTNTTAVPTAGAIAYGTGSAYGFSAAGTAGQVLESGGTGSPTWVSAASVGTNYFQLNSGVLSPITLTNDLAIGGSATTSALFQVSGTTGNATTSGIFTFGGTTAQLQATANRTLTLGGSSTGNIVLSSNGNIILNSFGAGVVHTSATGALSTGLVQNSELQNSTITVNGGTGLGVSGSPVALGGTLTLSNTGVTSALAGSGISLSGATGAVTITNAGVTSLNAGTGALTLANSSLTGSTITINNATTTTEGIASFNSTNFSISSGAVNTIQNINTSASPTFSGITLSGLTSGQFVKTTTGGQLTTSQYVNLTSDVTGILPVANGGTNTTAVPTAGAIAYGTGSAYGFSAAGTAGQVLESGGTGSPTWVSAASVGTNYFQLNSGVLSPITLTNDLAIGGSATTSALFQVSGTTGNATTSGIFTFGGTTAQLQATANRTLTLGGSSTGNIVLSSNGNIILNSFGAGVVHTSATGALSTGLVQNSELQNSTITVNGGTGLGVSGSPVALGGTLTLSNTGVTSALAGSGISLSGATGAVTITNAGVTSLNAGTGALTLANSSLTGSTITINNATTTTEGIASFNSTNFSISSGAVNTIQNINTSASPTFSGITLSGLTSGQFVKTTTGGQLTTSQYVNLTSDVTGILPVANGGTNTTAVPTAGAIAYGTGSAYGFSAAGTAGQVLESGGTGSPTWVSAASVGTNYFQLNSGVLSPITLTNDLAIGGSATTSALFQVSGTTGNATTSGIFTFGGTTAQLQATANRTLTLGGSSTGNIVLSSNGNIILNSFGAGVVHTSATGALSTGLVQNSELQNSTITVNGGTGLGVSGSPVALGGTLTLSNTGVTSALAGSGISLSGATGAVTITNAGVTSLNAGTGALTLANSSLTGSTITINNATTTTEGIASFNSTNFSISSGAVNTIQNINTSASPTFSGITLSGLTSGQFVKTTTGGQLTTSQYVNLTSDVTGILPVANGGTNTTAVPTAGAIAYGTGSAYGFSAAGTAGQVLESGGTGSPTWVSAASVGTNYFQLNSGVLSPITLTNDLAIGGSATTSALFQVSGTTGNATTSGIFTFGGTTAQLQATANRTLTLGGSSTGNIVLSSNGNIILNSFGAGVVHTSATGALSTGLVQNSELQNSTITVNGGTGLGVSGSPVALGGTLTLSNTGVTSALAGSGISLSGATGAVTITNAGVTSLNAGTGALTLANSSLTGSTITINNATTTTEGIASFNSTNFSISSGAVNTIQNINTSASPTFSGITLSGLTSGQFVKTTTGGQLTTSQYVNLTSDVTGILPVANGGTNTTAVPTAGAIAYGTGSAYGFSAAGTAGQVLESGGTGSPTWVSAASVGTNYFQLNSGVLSPITLTNDLAIGGSATTSALFQVSGTTGNATTSGIFTFGGTTAQLQATANRTLTLGGSSTGNIVLSSNGNIILNSFGAGVVHTSATGALSTGLVQNSELQNSTITVNGGTGLGVSGSPVALGGTLTLSNTGVTSALAGSGISLSGATGAVTITNAGVTSLNAGTGALTLANSSLTGSTITINNATTTTEGIASFNSTNFSISSGAVNTIQNINTSASPTFSGITLSGLTSGQFVKTTTGGQLTTSQYVNLTSDVTGILPVANGGTNTTAVPTAGAIAYGTGSAYGFSAAGTAGQVLESGGTGSPTWVSAASVGTNYFQLNSGVLSPITLTNDLAIGGSATTSALFQVSGTTGNATTSGIFTFGGTTAQLQATANRTLTLGGSSTGNIVLSSNGNIILNSFGAGVVHTSATGALSTGLVQNSELQNSTITVNGGTGLGVSGSPVALGGTLTLSNTGVTSALAGSGISLSGATGAVTITNAGVTSLNAGTGALTLANSSLTGSTITINNATTTTEGIASFNSTNFSISSGAVNTIQNINTSASPTFSGITLSGLTSGQFVKTTTGGQLTTSQYVNLTSDVTGILPVANGGTNTTAVPTAGAIAYGTGSAYGFSAAGTAGQVLESGGTGSPTWVSASTVGLNFWQSNNGALSPVNISNDLLLGGSSTTSAKFAFINNAGGTPTASISGNLSLAVPTGANPAALFNVFNGGSLNFQTSVGGDGGLSSRLYIANNGNVGIGTTSPSQALDVNGSIIVESGGKYKFASNSNAYIAEGYGPVIGLGGNTSSYGANFTNSSGTSVMYIRSDGNVGIGTTSPSQALDVNGSIIVESGGKYKFASNSNAYIAEGYGPVIGLGGNTSSYGANFTNSSGTSVMYIRSDGNVGIGTTSPTALLQVAGTASVSGQLALYGTPQIQSTANQTLTLGGTTTGDIQFEPGNSSTSLYLASNGNVGIGTASPLAKLQVAGNIALNSGYSIAVTNGVGGTYQILSFSNTNPYLVAQNGLLVRPSGASTPALIAKGATSQTADIFQVQNSNSTILFNVSSTGNVGIGTTTPTATLDVSGTASVSGELALNTTPQLQSTAMQTLTLGGTTTGDIAFQQGGVAAGSSLYLASSGNVGIGTTTPSYPLDVVGDINSSAYYRVGGNIALNLTTATDNTFLGITAANTSATGNYNTALGYGSLNRLTTGADNTATGMNSLFYNTTGQLNAATGYGAMQDNVGGSDNAAFGADALFTNSSGNYNAALGYGALQNNSSGSNNTAIGTNALIGNTTGLYNTGIGYQAGFSNATGSSNVFIGYQAGYNETGSNKLYIANSSTATPLIGGDFSAGTVTINGAGTVTGTTYLGTQTLTANGQANVCLFGNSTCSAAQSGNFNNKLFIYGGGGQSRDLILYQQYAGDAYIASSFGNLQLQTTSNNANIYLLPNGIGGVAVGNTAPGNGALVVNQANASGDIFSASQSGVTKFTIQNDGTLVSGKYTTANGIFYADGTGTFNQIAPGTANQCLAMNSSATGFTWGLCGGTGSYNNYWQLNNGAISPFSNTADLLLGGTATNSAEFAFTGVDTNTPVASIAATPSSGTTTGLSLSGNGIIQSLNNNTLTIGGNTTGNIAFEPGGSLSNFILSSNGTAQMTSTGGRILELGVSDAAPYANIGTVSNNTFQIITNNTQVAAFSTNGGFAIGKTYSSNTPPANGLLVQGNVGIGTTAPTASLNVVGTMTQSGGAVNINTTGVNTTSIGNVLGGAVNIAAGAVSSIQVANNLGTGGSSSSFKITNFGGVNFYALDDRSTTAGVIANTFAGVGPILTSAANATYTAMGVSSVNISYTGSTEVTSLESGTIINAPSMNDSSSLTVDNAAALTLAGAPTTSGSVTLTNGYGLKILAGSSNAVNTYGLFVDAATTGTNNYAAVFDGGNVGIGTTSPAFALDINAGTTLNGGAQISGSSTDEGLTLTNTNTDGIGWLIDSAASGSYYGGGNLAIYQRGLGGVPGLLLTSPAYSGGAGYLAGINIPNLSHMGATLDVRSGNGTLAIASVSGATSFAGMVVDNSGTGDLFTASNSGATKFVINNGGNVGIGTTSPVAKLETLSSGTYSNTEWNTANGFITSTGVSTSDYALYMGADKTNKLSYIQSVNVGVVPASLVLNARGGNVGIGTITPTALLDVAGTASVSGQLDLYGTPQLQSTAMQTLTLGGNTTGDIAFQPGGLSAGSSLYLASSGNVGIGTKAEGNASLVVNQTNGSGDILSASASGTTRFTVQNSGTVIIGNSTNGITFDPNNGGPVYAGSARPTKQIVLSPEYAGAVLTASGSANYNGFMTADASQSATPSSYNFENYYQWTSAQSSLNSYTIAVDVTLPKDFSSWPTSGNAITIDFNTALTTSADNALDVYIYKKGDTSGIPVYFSTNNTSSTAKTWQQITITKSQLEGTSTWNTAGGEAVIYLTMHAKAPTSNYVQVGNISLNYLSAF